MHVEEEALASTLRSPCAGAPSIGGQGAGKEEGSTTLILLLHGTTYSHETAEQWNVIPFSPRIAKNRSVVKRSKDSRASKEPHITTRGHYRVLLFSPDSAGGEEKATVRLPQGRLTPMAPSALQTRSRR